MYTCMYTNMYVCIYIYRERDIEREMRMSDVALRWQASGPPLSSTTKSPEV